MIKLFGKIRRKLIDSRDLKKYSIYAFGEVLLVVVGILIALQINNWNEDKKSKQFENKLKKEILKTIEYNFPDFMISLNYTKRAIRSLEIIINNIENKQIYHDSLSPHFNYSNVWAYQRFNPSAYERAKQYGLNFLKSDSLRILLTDIYDVHQNLLLQYEKRQHDFHYSTVTPFLADHFERIGEKGNDLVPTNYDSLKSNKKYRYILKTNYKGRLQDLRWLNMQEDKIENLKRLLVAEIE